MNTRFQRSPKIEMAPLQEETILLNPAINKFCLLNRTASLLWTHLETPATAEQLSGELCKSFSEVAPTEALRDVQQVLQQLIAQDFVVADPQT